MSHKRTFYELFMELKIELSEFGTLNLRFKLVQRHLVTHLFTIWQQKSMRYNMSHIYDSSIGSRRYVLSRAPRENWRL